MRALALALALAACSSSRTPIDAAPVGPAVSLRVDGHEVATVRAADLPRRVALASLLPADQRGGWRAVHATVGKRALDLDPFDDYVDLDVVLEPHGAEVTLAVYRPVPPGAPAHVAAELAKPRLALGGIELIEIRIADEPDATPAFASFTVEIGGASRVIHPRDLEAMTKVASSGSKADGWRLVDVLALVAPGAIAEVTITGETIVTMDAARLRKDSAILRPNRKGLIVLDVFRGAERVDHVRDITAITAR